MSAILGFCDDCRQRAKLQEKHRGNVVYQLCSACHALPDRIYDVPSPLLIGLLIVTLVISLFAFVWSLLPRW